MAATVKMLALGLLLAACTGEGPANPPPRVEVRVQRDSVPLVCAYVGAEKSDPACR